MPEENVFNIIDYENKTVSKPYPDKIKDIDLSGQLFDNIINAAEKSSVDLNTINSFSNISRSRNNVYELLDLMAQDPTISAILQIYAADATETNDQGRIMWCDSDDEKVLGMVTHLLDSMNVDKYAYDWVYSLVKYGDLYLRLYRESEFENDLFKNNKKKNLNEDVILKAFKQSDKYAEYIEMVKNPANVYDLVRYGKTAGYIRTHIKADQTAEENNMGVFNNNLNYYNYNFNMSDVDVYEATEFVHACLTDTSSRTDEEVTIFSDDDTNTQYNYSVRRGQSILYDSYKVWRELSLLENAVLLNRITKSAIIRTVSVEVGDMEKSAVQKLLNGIKTMMEQKSAINTGRSLTEYTNPGALENTIYIPTHEGKGAITTDQVGGDVNVGDLVDLDYWKKKLSGSLAIPRQYIGDTDDSTGFNGGTSLSLISSRYAKTVKRIQNCFIQAITDAVNLMLYDRGLYDYINKFTLKMQAPTTQEEKDRKENMANTINTIQTIMGLVDSIEDQTTKLTILKALLSTAISDMTVITAIQEEIDRLKAEKVGEETPEEETGEEELGGEGELGGEEEFSAQPVDLGGSNEELPELDAAEEGEEAPAEEPEESFLTDNDGELLLEDNDLPSFEQLGISYESV